MTLRGHIKFKSKNNLSPNDEVKISLPEKPNVVIDNTTIEAGDKFTTTDIDKYYHNGERRHGIIIKK